MPNEGPESAPGAEASDQIESDAIHSVTWDGASSHHPYNWSDSRRSLILWISVSVTFLVGINATSEATAGEAVNQRFGISDTSFQNSYLPITSWNMGAALGPPVFLALMENFGIRKIYLVNSCTSLP